MKQNFLLLSVAALILASCSTTVDRTSSAFGGGWGMDTKKSNPTKTAATTTAEKTTTPKITLTTEDDFKFQEESLSADNKLIHLTDLAAERNVKSTVFKQQNKHFWKSPSVLRPIISKFEKKLNTVKIKRKAISTAGGGDGIGFSIASLVLGILGLVVFGWLFGTLAIIFGVIGMNRDGRGMAIAGLILGILDIILWAIVLLIFLATI
jgi:hypothetical protein